MRAGALLITLALILVPISPARASSLTWAWEGVFPGISTPGIDLPAGGPVKLSVTFETSTPASIVIENSYGNSPAAYYVAMTGATLSFAGRQYTSEGAGAIEVNVHCLGASGPQCANQRLTEFRIHGSASTGFTSWSGPSLAAGDGVLVRPDIAWGGMFHDTNGALPTTHPGTGFIDVGYGQNTPSSGFFRSSPATIRTVGVPEPLFIGAILPRLPTSIRELEIRSALMWRLQRATAWGTTVLLRAVQWPAQRDGEWITLSRVKLEIQEACAGLRVWIVLTILMGLIAWTSRTRRLPLKIMLLMLAIPLALEANALRIAAYGVALDSGMPESASVHEWFGWAAYGVVLLQVIGLGRFVNSPFVNHQWSD